MNQQLNHYLIKTLHRRLRLPRNLVYSISSKISALPFSDHRRNEINSRHDTHRYDTIPDNQGFKLFSEKEIPGQENIIKECNSIFEKNRAKYDDEYFIKNPNKRFLLTIASDEQLLEHPHIKEFIKSDFVNDRVSSYLDHPYVLSTLRLWWTPLNDTSVSSQKFHLDEEDLTQVKVFMNISDCTQDHGPFTFLSSASSAGVLANYRNGKRRYSDEEVFKILPKNDVITLTGQTGSGAFIDTSKCLHYGSRSNTKERLVLMAQFLKSNAPLLTNSLHL